MMLMAPMAKHKKQARTPGQGGKGPGGPRRPRPEHQEKTNKSSGLRKIPDSRGTARAAKASPRATEDDRWLYGTHAVLAALANPDRACRRLVIAAQSAETLEDQVRTAAGRAESKGTRRPAPEIRDRAELDHLLPRDAVHQGLALEVAPLVPPTLEEIAKNAPETALLVALDQASDPRNIGAVLRAAAAFGARAVIVPDRHAPHITAAMAKAASGAVETVPLVRVPNLTRGLEILKKGGFWCFGLAGEAGQDIDAADFSGRAVLVVGAEGEGLRRLTRETCDHLVRIPISSTIESLNMATATAIALYEAAKGQKAKDPKSGAK